MRKKNERNDFCCLGLSGALNFGTWLVRKELFFDGIYYNYNGSATNRGDRASSPCGRNRLCLRCTRAPFTFQRTTLPRTLDAVHKKNLLLLPTQNAPLLNNNQCNKCRFALNHKNTILCKKKLVYFHSIFLHFIFYSIFYILLWIQNFFLFSTSKNLLEMIIHAIKNY